ncbi:MAG: phosphoglycerate dehydrogenase [Phycisphaerae bacterium]|nr:phosphoglycerate dehydrogenase [Planctomycetota bacterium]MBL7221481.1 phosphoglycerate dehydrogenase [Phycisphaerae bacterium]
MGKILVTPRSVTRDGHPALKRLTEAGYELVFSTPGAFPGEDELIELLPGCVGYLAGVEEISSRVLDAAAGLKVISRNGTGVDSVDLGAADRNGVRVLRAAGANARGVAELTFGHIIAAVRSIPFSDAAMKDQQWTRRKGIELAGRKLGLIGCGMIGRLVAGFALAFDMDVIACDPFADMSFKPSKRFAFASIDDVLATSDIISLHCPPQDGGALIDAASIGKMKDGVYLINTARASLIDDSAVLAGLESGKIAGVVVDAFDPEPPADWRLAGHPKVIGTPHIGGFTPESIDRAVSAAVDNLLKALK